MTEHFDRFLEKVIERRNVYEERKPLLVSDSFADLLIKEGLWDDKKYQRYARMVPSVIDDVLEE